MPDIRVDEILRLTEPLKGDATTIVVQDLQTRRVTMQALSSIIANSVPSDTPVGQVSFFATTVAPNGWIECKGSKLNIVGEYNELYKAIGHTFTDILNPSVDKSKYFYAPDLRGYFIRGLDNGANVDEDTTRKLGSIQEDSIESHTHSMSFEKEDTAGGDQQNTLYNVDPNDKRGTGSLKLNADSFGGAETRPKNIALLPCIKYSAAKGPATPVTSGSSSSTFTGIDISKDSGSVGSVTELKFTGNVDVSKTGDVGTINVKSSGSGGRPTILGFPVFKNSYWIRSVITDEPSLFGWGQHTAWLNLDVNSINNWPPMRYTFDNSYLIDNPNLRIVKSIISIYYQVLLLSDGTLWLNGFLYTDGLTGFGKSNDYTRRYIKLETNIKFDDFDVAVDNNTQHISFAAIERTTRKLYTWGLNNTGQLAQNSTTDITSPTLVSDNSTKKVKEVVFSTNDGGAKLLVLYDDNTLYSCGANEVGQLGIGNTTKQNKLIQCKKNSTTLVSDAKKIVGTGNGNNFNSAYISTSDELFVCGYNGVGNLGDGTKTNSSYFIKVNIPEKVKQVVTAGGWLDKQRGDDNTYYAYGTNYLVLGESGKMYSWGRNHYGQLGHGDTTDTVSPKLIDSMKGIVIQKIFGQDGWGSGRAFACLDVNGKVYMTGYSVPSPSNGYLLTKACTTYTRIQIPEKVVDVALVDGAYKGNVSAGNFFAGLFLTENNKLFSFGVGGAAGEVSNNVSFPVEIKI